MSEEEKRKNILQLLKDGMDEDKDEMTRFYNYQLYREFCRIDFKVHKINYDDTLLIDDIYDAIKLKQYKEIIYLLQDILDGNM